MPPSPRDPDYRPLIAATPRRIATGVEFDVGTRVVAVEGPTEQLLAVAALCDGRHSASAVASAVQDLDPDDLAGLLESLAAAGAVVDTTEAWRVFHRWTGADSGLGRGVTDAEVLEMLAERYTQPALGSAAVPLDAAPTALDGLLARRRSSELGDAPHALSFYELSALLAAMYAGDGYGGRPVPSGGGLYPLVIHVVLRAPLGPLDAGVWWYDTAARRLRRVDGAVGTLDDALVGDPNTVARVARDQPVALVSADVARGARKYASRAYRLALMEVGAVMQNAYLVAADIGVPVRALLGVDDAGATALLALPDGSVPLLAIVLGQ